MTVRRNKKDQLVITLDPGVDEVAVQRILDRILFEELARKAKKVSQRRMNDIADSITAAYWERVQKQLRADRRR